MTDESPTKSAFSHYTNTHFMRASLRRLASQTSTASSMSTSSAVSATTAIPTAPQTATRQQPPWISPTAADGLKLPPLRIYNSLTRTKTPFVPLDRAGKTVTWYACGPTVYDEAHLGHARNYVTTDVLRRILRDYFRFKVKFVQNVTDVDDKIILRARQQHFLKQFTAKHSSFSDELLQALNAAFEAYIKKNLPRLSVVTPEDFDTQADKLYGDVLAGKCLEADGAPGDKEAKVKMHLRSASSAAKAIADARSTGEDNPDVIISKAADVLLPYLDYLHSTEIDGSDHSIFRELTTKYESLFTRDMRDLNVQDPDVITRVTEYGPQIVKFVEKIVENKFAYSTDDGSVYFDIDNFEKGGYPYSRLEPWNRNDKALQADGEGALTTGSGKRHQNDFAVWKSSKQGEPHWQSPWGAGRPGWHIECSAMASDVLGKSIDIHSGGIDLAFPHHDNELAQSEAYWDNGNQWISYFLHMGHLSIAGSKMSKSLKNFTTIREALDQREWTPRGLRIVFLLGTGWQSGIEITEDLVKASVSWEDRVQSFFVRAKDLELNPSANDKIDSEADGALAAALSEAQLQLDTALCDNFNYSQAMRIISNLIGQYNSAEGPTLSDETVLSIARWITNIVTIFGLDDRPVDASDAPAKEMDLELSQTSLPSSPTTHIGWSGVDIPEAAKPYVYPLSALRDTLRRAAIDGISSSTYPKLIAAASDPAVTPTGDPSPEGSPFAEALKQFQNAVKHLAAAEAPANDLLRLCDALRDTTLWPMGVYLEDRAEPGTPALVRPVDRELAAARQAKDERDKAKKLAKEKREREEREKADKRREQGKLAPEDMFKTEEYSAWNEDGMPTKDKEGNDVSKAKSKKLRKDWEKQKKLHAEFMGNSDHGQASTDQ